MMKKRWLDHYVMNTGIIGFTHQSYLLNNPHNVGEFQGKFNGKQNLEVGLEARINSVFKMILTPLN